MKSFVMCESQTTSPAHKNPATPEVENDGVKENAVFPADSI